jgi:hypothetical protein
MTNETKRITPNVKRSDDMDALFTECQVFWAFSREQLAQGKAGLPEGEKLVDIGAGGFMPAKNIDKLIAGMKVIDAAFKEAMRDAKARRDHILYELNNHEAYYTRDIESTLDALGDDFSEDEVLAVFRNNKTVLV